MIAYDIVLRNSMKLDLIYQLASTWNTNVYGTKRIVLTENSRETTLIVLQ